MSLLERTKRCPACAERIKAAAIRCRYCGEEQPREVVTPAPAPAAAPTPAATSTSAADRRWIFVGIALSLLVTVALAVPAVMTWRDTTSLREAQDAGRTVRATVADTVQQLLSYDYRTFDQDVSTAMEALTPRFREEYEPTVEEIEAEAKEQKRVQTTQVASVSVVEQEPEQVEALLFINTISKAAGSADEQLIQNRIRVTLVRDDAGQWLIDDLSVPVD